MATPKEVKQKLNTTLQTETSIKNAFPHRGTDISEYKWKKSKVTAIWIDMIDSTKMIKKLGHKKSGVVIKSMLDGVAMIAQSRSHYIQFQGDGALIVTHTPKPNNEKVANMLTEINGFLLHQFQEKVVNKFDWYPEYRIGVHVGNEVAIPVGNKKTGKDWDYSFVSGVVGRANAISIESNNNIAMTEDYLEWNREVIENWCEDCFPKSCYSDKNPIFYLSNVYAKVYGE